MTTLVWVLNGIFTINALASYFAFIGGKRSMFALGLFSNAYMMFIGVYYGWYATIAMTTYFIVVNIVGWIGWGKEPKSLNTLWLLMMLAISIALYCYSLFGFKDIAAVTNFIGVAIYGVAYTLRLYKKQKRLAMVLFTVNQLIYLPMVILASPVLWGCVGRQSLMVIINITTIIKPDNWLVVAVTNIQTKNKN
jgi:hypothetical protein